VRQADGTPLAVPGWMTRPEAAHAKIGSFARLPLRELLELQRVTVAYLAAREHNVHEEAHDVTAPSKTPTTTLRRTAHGSRRTTAAGGASTATPGTGAVDASAGQDGPQGGRA